MTHPLIPQLATEMNVTIEEINAILAGERPANDDNLFRIIDTLTTDARGIYVFAVWKGAHVPNALRNLPVYDFFGQILESLNLFLDKKGYTSRLLVTNYELVDYQYYDEIIMRHPNVGLINVAANFTGDLQRACQHHQRPLLYLDYPDAEDADDQYIIGANAKLAIEEVVLHLYQLGHRRIAFIKGPQNKLSAIDRFKGYCKGLAAVGITYDEALVQSGVWNHPSGALATEKLLMLNPRPTAIIASNDLMAFGAMTVIGEHGLRIPDHISVVGYDDIAATLMTTPRLASVHIPMSAIGAKAGETIIDLLEGRHPEPKHVYFPLEFIVRESVGPVSHG